MSDASYYYDKGFIESALSGSDDGHRSIIGGMWDELGQLQIDFLVKCGLKPEHALIDIGCGSFRGGVKFIEYLNPENYYGIDISNEIMGAGYEREIVQRGLDARFPQTNMRVSQDFSIQAFGVRFDYAIAQSVFSHLPIRYLQQCLAKIHTRIKPGGLFFATYFDCPPWHDFDQPRLQERGGVTTHPGQDPYHYRTSDLILAARSGWQVEWLGDWDHPRNQKMAVFRRR
ncbi:MAG: class I SAM-dependent methyltransferase [Oceanicaulis sp.]